MSTTEPTPLAKPLIKPLIVIPARMASIRLPGKPLADICGAPMIVQVWRRACEANVGRVIVACSEQEVADVVHAAGGEAIMTDPDHPSGTDRVHEVVEQVDPQGAIERVINVQGDLPALDPSLIQQANALLDDSAVDMSTLAAAITDEQEKTNPNVVKAIVSASQDGSSKGGRALYFSRATAPYGDGPLYHHIGLYGFRRSALRHFVSMPPSPLELREKLEQLRALEAGMRIDVGFVDTVPHGVDTPADLEKARAMLKNKSA